MLGKAKKAWRIYREKGLPGVARRAVEKYKYRRDHKIYRIWLEKCDALTEEKRASLRHRAENLNHKPLISVLMPVYNVDEQWLRRAIESVRNQIYPHWEFCIADDCSPKPHIRRVLEEYARRDERIKVVFRAENGHISAASNSALEIATGEFCALLDHDDELAEHALLMVAEEIDAHPATDMIYSDEDMIDERGRRYAPKFKPDWSPDLFYSLNLITHLSVYRTEVLRRIEGFRVGLEGSQDYDLALRVIEKIPARNIRHIPRILYHWRAVRGSVALSSDEKPYAHNRARQAIEEHFARRGVAARAVRGVGELHRTIYPLPEKPPLVSLISIAENDAAGLIANVLAETDYDALELIVVAGANKKIYADKRVKLIEAEEKSFYARLNQGARAASGEVLCFLDDSTRIKNRGWLRELTVQALQKETGAVGAKVLYPNKRVKHAGLIVGVGDGIGRAHHKAHKDELGNFMRLAVTQNFSAVAIDCLAVRREVYESAGGFDAENYPRRFADVDFCLRLLEKGFRNVWTPWAEIVQTEKTESEADRELEKLKTRWREFFVRDPYFNPNFSKQSAEFTLSLDCAPMENAK